MCCLVFPRSGEIIKILFWCGWCGRGEFFIYGFHRFDRIFQKCFNRGSQTKYQWLKLTEKTYLNFKSLEIIPILFTPESGGKMLKNIISPILKYSLIDQFRVFLFHGLISRGLDVFISTKNKIHKYLRERGGCTTCFVRPHHKWRHNSSLFRPALFTYLFLVFNIILFQFWATSWCI